MNFSQQQVIAWLPSGHTICSTETIRGKPKIVTFFFGKAPLWPSLIQSRFLHRLFRPKLQCCGDSSRSRRRELSDRASKSRNGRQTHRQHFSASYPSEVDRSGGGNNPSVLPDLSHLAHKGNGGVFTAVTRRVQFRLVLQQFERSEVADRLLEFINTPRLDGAVGECNFIAI